MNCPGCGARALFWAAAWSRNLRGLRAPAIQDLVLTDVNIEPTNLCSANCVFCDYQFQDTPHLQMNLETAERIIAAAKRAGVKRLGLTPIVGEPLIFKNLEGIVRIAKQGPTPMLVGVTTNGILLTPKRFESLVSAGVDTFSVSMCYPMSNLEGIFYTCDSRKRAFFIGVRTPKIRWKHPLFTRAKKVGVTVERNLQFDGWSGMVGDLPNSWRRSPASASYG